MTSTPETIDSTLLDASVLDDLAFEFTPECEMPGHDSLPTHDGPAKWLMHEFKHPCGRGGTSTRYVCHMWKTFMQKLGTFRCIGRGCGQRHSMDIIRFTPIFE